MFMLFLIPIRYTLLCRIRCFRVTGPPEPALLPMLPMGLLNIPASTVPSPEGEGDVSSSWLMNTPPLRRAGGFIAAGLTLSLQHSNDLVRVNDFGDFLAGSAGVESLGLLPPGLGTWRRGAVPADNRGTGLGFVGESSSSVMVLRSCWRFSKESWWVSSGGGRTNVWVSISSTISELRLRVSESVGSCGASTTRDLCSRNFIFIRPNTARVPQLITFSSSTFSGS